MKPKVLTDKSVRCYQVTNVAPLLPVPLLGRPWKKTQPTTKLSVQMPQTMVTGILPPAVVTIHRKLSTLVGGVNEQLNSAVENTAPRRD